MKKEINEKKGESGKVGKKSEKKMKKKKKVRKKDESNVDYYCNPPCIGCRWIVNFSYPLSYYLINDKKTEPFYNFIISEK